MTFEIWGFGIGRLKGRRKDGEGRVELRVDWDVDVDVASSNCVLDLAITSVN